MDLSEAKQRLFKYFEEACDVMLFKIKGIAFQFERIGEGRFYNLDFFFEFEANNLVVNEDILETDAKNDDDYDLRQAMYLAARLFYQDFQIVYYNNHKPILESEDTIKLWIENKEKQILYTNATNDFDFHNQPLHIDGDAFSILLLMKHGFKPRFPKSEETESKIIKRMKELSLQYFGQEIEIFAGPEPLNDPIYLSNHILGKISSYLSSIGIGNEAYAAIREEKPYLRISLRHGRDIIAEFIPAPPPVKLDELSINSSQEMQHDALWYHHPIMTFYVDMQLNCNYNHEVKALRNILEDVLPLSNEKDQRCITEILNNQHISYEKIEFDTFRKQYVIFNTFIFLQNTEKNIKRPKDKLYYKYMSLQTYMAMLQNSSFRMNSITSMNDTSESFFLGDLLGELEFIGESSYAKEIENKDILISSFCTNRDDAVLWENYGDCFKGVCLVFEIEDSILRPIIYLTEENPEIQPYKEAIKELRSKGINIHFSGVDDYACYTKSSQFESEHEFRLAKKQLEKSLSYTIYGDNLICAYRDFKFDNYDFGRLGIKPVELIIGANMPNQDVNFPLLVHLSFKKFGIKAVNRSKQNKKRR